MADDNVVRPTFGRKKPEVAETTAPAEDGENGQPTQEPASDISDDYEHVGSLEGEALVRAQKDLIYMLANNEFVHAMRNKLEEAGDTIFNLIDYAPDPKSIRLRRQGLKSYSLQDICKEVEKTHQLQWRSQPSYLGALTLEHHYRVQLALSLMNEENSSPKG